MTGLALGLVIFSAFLHSTWNLLVKRASGGVAFVWLFSTLMALFYTPIAFAVIVISRPALDPIHLVFMIGSGLLHVFYYVLLDRGYQKGDLSLVYPLARGTGPMLVAVGAVVLLGERPTFLGIVGILCIGLGVLVFMEGPSKLRDEAARQGIVYALIVGLFIGSYTVWDKYAMSVLLISPLLYQWSVDLLRALILTAMVRNQWDSVRGEWQIHRKEAVGVALLCTSAYLIILIVMRLSPVSYVAPLREISIVIGAIMGTKLLAEGDVTRRWSGALVIGVGVICLALAG